MNEEGVSTVHHCFFYMYVWIYDNYYNINLLNMWSIAAAFIA